MSEMAMMFSSDATSPSILNMGRMTTSNSKSPSEEELWKRLNKRTASFLSGGEETAEQSNEQEDGSAKKKKKKICEEDIKLLDKGLEAVASSLNQLTHTLETAVEGGINLAETKLSDLFSVEAEAPKSDCPSPQKRQRIAGKTEDILVEGKGAAEEAKLRDPRNLAKSMASKARFLEREMKSLKADLCFMRERCSFLEEENRRLRDGFVKGVRLEDDDLVRLQLEALLAEKGRLAQENASYARENQYLHQLVEYHQLTLQDMASFDDTLPAMCLDFSSASPSPYSSPQMMMKRKAEDDEHPQSPSQRRLQFPSPPLLPRSHNEDDDNVNMS